MRDGLEMKAIGCQFGTAAAPAEAMLGSHLAKPGDAAAQHRVRA